jgi:hypothetical protein
LLKHSAFLAFKRAFTPVLAKWGMGIV